MSSILSDTTRKAYKAAAKSKKAADFMGVSQKKARKKVKSDAKSPYRKRVNREMKASKLTDERPGY